MQQLWLDKVGWDESIPSNILNDWQVYTEQLMMLNQISIPRHALKQDCKEIDIHGFSDASSRAYGACLYVRRISEEGNISTLLLCAKSKVAPLKTLSIPRLELCAALLLARLVKRVITDLKRSINDVVLWTDSAVVLAWLQHSPSNLRTFVANRVATIQVLTKNHEWRHVPTCHNPADLISRGVLPNKLIRNELWWKGPNWLSMHRNSWPALMSYDKQNSDLPEVEMRSIAMTATSPEEIYTCFNISRYSSLKRAEGVIAYILRYGFNLRNKKENRRKLALSLEERTAAHTVLIKLVQHAAFKEEIASLSKGKTLKNSSNLLALTPFVDSEGLLRVGGRLRNSDLNYDGQHQILLPKAYHFVQLLFSYKHKELMHIGPLGLLHAVRQRYWPICGQNTAKYTVRSCVTCFRCKPKVISPIMGDLPAARAMPNPPFFNCGVDYAGPVKLKTFHGRGCKTYKGYIAIFICLAIKAVHIELVTDLSSAAFLTALRRMVARRGKPKVMWSDNGTNFVGAYRELKELYEWLRNFDIATVVELENISWNFIPVRSPHFGGLWEAGLREIKHHIHRVVSDQALTYEDYSSLLVQVEAILNSRPISSNPTDLLPITPAHFLVGRPLVDVPTESYTNASISSLTRYEKIQAYTAQLWDRWRKEYLNNLQKRTKWRKGKARSPRVGELAVLMDDNQPPRHWRMGRVLTLHPGKDNVTRVVTLRTTTGTVRRAVSKICLLPERESTSEEIDERDSSEDCDATVEL